MQLRFKIALLVFCPTAALLMLTLLTMQNLVSDDLASVRDSSFKATTSILSEPVVEAFLEQDFARLDEFFLNLRQSPDILEGVAVDRDLKIIASADPRQLGKPFVAIGENWYTSELVVGGRERGTLWLHFDESQAKAALGNVFATGILLSTVTLLILAAVAYWIGNQLSRSMGALAQSAQRFAQGELTHRTGMKGGDEISSVGQAFDIMADQIQSNMADLHRSEQRTSLALSAGGMGIWVYEARERNVHIDDRLAELYEVHGAHDNVAVDQLLSRVHPDDAESRAAFFDEALVTDAVVSRDFRVRRTDGSIRWVRSQATALFAGTKGSLVIGIDQDITDETLRFSEIERLKDELMRSNSELDDFAHIASHDLKEPLRGISNYANFLKEDYGDDLDDTANQYIDRMISLSKNLSDMIADLLRMSRITRLDSTRHITHWQHVIEDIRESLAFTFEEKQVELTADDTLAPVTLDPAALRELLRNLIVNGVKYNESDIPTIHVGYDPAAAAFFVEDNGIGIAEQHIPEVFAPFRHLNPHDRYGRSTGLGATICQKLVTNAGGKIWITSEVGTGSKFWFTLPTA
ncbi:sensor histidine kinase [Litorivicinus lipolyticus]|uniref:sensor histidine kinase n=1 Tax=Litorivicinus lipolyticus TaxID=418701 RepID=UPI003B5B6B8F